MAVRHYTNVLLLLLLLFFVQCGPKTLIVFEGLCLLITVGIKQN